MSNILFYTDTPNVGGAEKQMALLAKHLKLRGCSVSLAYGKYSALGRHPELLSNYDKTFVLNVIHKHDPRHYFELRRILSQEKFDLVHLHLWNPGACRYAFMAAASNGVPIVTTEHDPFELRGIKRALKLRAFRRTVHTIAISQQGEMDLQKWYGIPDDKISVVNNGIDSTSFPRKRESIDPRLLGDDIMITCIAELHERKGHKYLLEAFLKLQSTTPNLQLQLVGTGPLEKELKSCYGANPNIHFLGWRDDVPEILSKSDLLVLPSLKEAFGLVVLEAMASGVVVIGTDGGGVRDIIRNGVDGLLVPPANSDVLAEAMEKLLCNPEQKRALEETALKRVQEFSAERMTEETFKIYSSVLPRIPSPSR
ncbi:MAG: glycosyltransferase family 4 protein [Candidatus Peregrinibacteria bacterium]